MSSVLDDIIADAPTSTPSTLPTQQNTQPVSDDNDDSPLDSDPEGSGDGTEDQDTQTQASGQDSCDTVAAFTINTARNLRLTADGEKSLIEFSQVFISSYPPVYIIY